MKRITKKSLERLSLDLQESWRIEAKMLKTNERLTQEEIGFLKARADEGSPLGEFDYGLYYLLMERDEKTADEWWNKFFYHCNGEGLLRASGIFAYLGDEYYDWSMRCLKRAAWRKNPIAIGMLKEMKAHPYHFPEA